MIYTHKTISTLILGIIMVAFGNLVQAGVLNPMIEFLGTSKFVGKPESPGEMIILPFVCGIIAIVVGLWQFAVRPKEGNLDYYLSTVGGVMHPDHRLHRATDRADGKHQRRLGTPG